jgi:hypothetical protein
MILVSALANRARSMSVSFDLKTVVIFTIAGFARAADMEGLTEADDPGSETDGSCCHYVPNHA